MVLLLVSEAWKTPGGSRCATFFLVAPGGVLILGTTDKLARRAAARMGLAVTLLLLLPFVVDPPNNNARSATKEFRRMLRVGVEGSVFAVVSPGVF